MVLPDDRGVSPVVGVMLMLSVTVMIAAVVSAAAGGLSGTSKKAPNAILDVKIYANQTYGSGAVPTIVIEHVSGNVIPTRDLQIYTYYRTSSGISQGNLSGIHEVTCGLSSYPALYIKDDDTTRFADLKSAAFGNASANLRPGDILVTPARYCAEAGLTNNPSMSGYFFPGIANFAQEFRPGSYAAVKVVHIPSGQVIFSKDVVIE
jgi:FlaG/FlaF family flagellin (archaellin)